MKKWIISFLIIAIAATGSYFYFTNAGFKNTANQFVEKNIIGKEDLPPVTKAQYKWDVFYIADPTGSGYTQYLIPQIEVAHLNRMADSIHRHGGGRLWLSYIDDDSKNNECIYLLIPAGLLKENEPPVLKGETSFEADDRKKAWQKRVAGFSQDSSAHETAFQTVKAKFLKDCEDLLTKKIYIKGSSRNQWSDVIGSMNASFKTLRNISDTVAAYKYVIAFSDLQHDIPRTKKTISLDSLPSGVTLIAVNPSPGSSKKCTQQLIELENPERVFETVFINN